MPIPLIVAAVIAAGVASGGGGLALGGKGAVDIKHAKRRISDAIIRHNKRRADTELRLEIANWELSEYGKQQALAYEAVVKRMRDFLIRNAKKVKANEALLIDGFDTQSKTMGTVDGPGLSEALGIIGGLAGGTLAGASAGAAAGAIAGAVGTASTGTAISGLSGAAATNATMAWLGGGAISAGGGGMAAGALVLNSVIAGPALLVGGFAVSKQGAKAKTKAVDAETQVNVATAQLDLFDEGLRAVRAGERTQRGPPRLSQPRYPSSRRTRIGPIRTVGPCRTVSASDDLREGSQ